MTGYSKAEFLRAVLPPEQNGQYYCSLFIGKHDVNSPVSRTIQRFHHSIDELIEVTDTTPTGVWDVFYLVATSRGENRKRESIVQHKAFFLDVDLKEYKDKKTAFTALQNFYTALELPAPTLVDSGNGIHAYWIMSESISTFEWCRVAEHLKQLCVDSNFHADPSVTADVARILRVPDTYNMKDPNNPKRCVCAHLTEPMEFELFKALIGYVERDSFDELELKYAPTADSVTKNILSASTQHKLFQHGLLLSVQGIGCEYLRIAYQHQEVLSEPQWRSALSIAQYCNDRDKGIHSISKRYPTYSKADTEKKAEAIPGPHTCEQFRSVFASMDQTIPGPVGCLSFCDSCIHKKVLKSPISLCVTHQEAKLEDSVIETVDNDTGLAITINVPVDSYPAPYSRGIDGGVFKRARIDVLENGDTPSLQELQGKIVYQYDLWVDSLQVDPLAGEVIVLNLKQPRQPLVRFAIPLNKVTALSEFTDSLSKHGVAAPNYKELMEYVKAFVTKLQKTMDKIMCPVSFGWDSEFSSFVLGSRRYTSTGEIEFCLPSEATENASRFYGMRNLGKVIGSSDEEKMASMLTTWKNIFKLHARPRQEPRLFAVFVSMGSPMFAFFNNIDGVILHLVSKESGVGKSAVQHVANSVWGVPDKNTLMNLRDTKLSIFQHLGVLRHVCMCIDEITMIEPEQCCQFCFDISAGRGRHRMEANTNRMRANVTEWRTPVITSGNNGLHQLMTQYKLVVDGEAMRVMEMEVFADAELQDPTNKAMTDKMFSEDLMSCYGVVGDMLLKYYVTHADECRTELMEIRKRFDSKAGLTQKERYYSALCATAILGATVSKRLGIHDVDLDAFEDWAVKFCRGSSDTAELNRLPLIDQMREFLHETVPHTLATTVVNGKLSIAKEATHNLVHVRQVRDAGHVYVSYRYLKEWCTQRAVPLNNMVEAMEQQANGVVTATKLELTSTVSVRCLRMDLDKLGIVTDENDFV
jgi:hypothetical protein